MTQPQWDEYLVAEHEMIERAMAVLKVELEGLDARKATTVRLRRAVDFLLLFGDTIHNAKEERHLFPLMEERGVPRQGGPLAVMLAEHEAERQLLARLLDASGRLSELSAEEVQALVGEGEAYLKVRAEHIWKENDVLYPMGRRVLTADDNEHLLAEFERLGREVYGEAAAGHFKAQLDELERGGREKRLIESLSYEQLDAMMEALPVEVTFVDADDTVAYFNRLDKEKIFVRSRSVIGRKVFKCHPGHSVDRVKEIVDGFRAGTLERADFWIDFKGEKVLIRYLPVRGDGGEYLGVLEVTQALGWVQSLTGQKRLLDG